MMGNDRAQMGDITNLIDFFPFFELGELQLMSSSLMLLLAYSSFFSVFSHKCLHIPYQCVLSKLWASGLDPELSIDIHKKESPHIDKETVHLSSNAGRDNIT